MCFSAEASFTIGTVLTASGIATIKKVGAGRRLLIAMMPLLFGLQQYCEGIVWLSMNGVIANETLAEAAKLSFLGFAWILWPVYAPIAFLLPETIPWRRSLFSICLILGALAGGIDLLYVFTHTVETNIVGGSIEYGHPITAIEYVLYGSATIPPLLLSSLPGIWIVGLCLIISFFLAQWIWTMTVTSVWCFFAAGISFLLYAMLEKKQPLNRRV